MKMPKSISLNSDLDWPELAPSNGFWSSPVSPHEIFASHRHLNFDHLTPFVLPFSDDSILTTASHHRVHLRAGCRKTYRSQQCDRSGQRQNRFPRKLVVCRECQIPIEPVRHHLIPGEGREAD